MELELDVESDDQTNTTAKEHPICCCKVDTAVEDISKMCGAYQTKMTKTIRAGKWTWTLKAKSGDSSYRGSVEVVAPPKCSAEITQPDSKKEKQAREWCRGPTPPEGWYNKFVEKAKFYRTGEANDPLSWKTGCEEFKTSGLYIQSQTCNWRKLDSKHGSGCDVTPGSGGERYGQVCTWDFKTANCWDVEIDGAKGNCMDEEDGVQHKRETCLTCLATGAKAKVKSSVCPAGYKSDGCTCDTACA